MTKLFISYRRDDSQDITGRICDHLKPHFEVFRDVDSMPLGVDFREHIGRQVQRCDCLLAVIGPHWLEAAVQGRRRLDDPADLVRVEIESALARGIPVVPVLTGGARMPGERELPPTLAALAYRHAAVVSSGADFQPHVERLVRGLKEVGGHPGESLGAVAVTQPFSANVVSQTGTAPSGVNRLWHSRDERLWSDALGRYWQRVRPANLGLERAMEELTPAVLRPLDARGWCDFLHDKYFPWKYTAPNRLASTRRSLRKYVETGTLDELLRIKEELLWFPVEDVAKGVRIAMSIRGLGIAGATGLLSLLYPATYATADPAVLTAMLRVDGLPERPQLERIKPATMGPADAAVLIRVMQEKAATLNREFGTDRWTPRKIDQVLWAVGG